MTKSPLACALLATLAACATTLGDVARTEGAIVRGSTARRELALVFTGGEFGEGTDHVLDVLARLGLGASFFLTGDFLAVPGWRDAVPRMVEAGHYVGPHSHAHLLYCSWDDRRRTLVTEAEFAADLERNIADLRALGALPPGQAVWFIPPYEWFNREQVVWARKLGVELFSFTPGSGSNRDYIPEGEPGFVSSARIAAEVLAHEERDPDGLNGFLLLLHLGSRRTDKMHAHLEPLLRELVARGYTFRRVDELL